MSARVALKMVIACCLVSLGVSGCVVSGNGGSRTAEEYRQLARDLESAAGELEAVNWYGAQGARFKYQELVGGTGLLDLIRDERHSALARLEAMEARTGGNDTGGELGTALETYFRTSRSFYAGLGETIDYFEQVAALLEQESEAREAFYIAPVAGDEAAVGDAYRQTLSDAIDGMRVAEAPALLKELHKTEIEWLKARLDHLDRSRVAGEGGDDEVSQLIEEKAAEWTAFRKAFEELESEVAEESEEAREAAELERLLDELQRAIADKL